MVKWKLKCSKGIIPLIELMVAATFLIILVNLLFPSFVREERWEDAVLSLRARDLLFTMDRCGMLYNYSFDQEALLSFLDPFLLTFPGSRQMLATKFTKYGNASTIYHFHFSLQKERMR